MRYTVHKKIYKVSLFGPNDDWKNNQIHNTGHLAAVSQMVKYVDSI